MKTLFQSAILLLASSLPAAAATDWYDSASRTIYVTFEQPVGGVSVHITGNSALTGKCIAPMSEVKVMNFVPAQTVKSNKTLTAKLSAMYKGVKGEIAASSASEATSTRPAVYSYNYTGTIRNLHYNTVYIRGNTRTARGWRPDNGGGCTYPVK